MKKNIKVLVSSHLSPQYVVCYNKMTDEMEMISIGEIEDAAEDGAPFSQPPRGVTKIRRK